MILTQAPSFSDFGPSSADSVHRPSHVHGIFHVVPEGEYLGLIPRPSTLHFRPYLRRWPTEAERVASDHSRTDECKYKKPCILLLNECYCHEALSLSTWQGPTILYFFDGFHVLFRCLEFKIYLSHVPLPLAGPTYALHTSAPWEPPDPHRT